MQTDFNMFIQDVYGLPDYDIMPFEVGYLPDVYVRKAERELNETPQAIERGIRQLRELIASDKSTSAFYHVEDEVLLQYLRARKFNFPKAFSNFRSYVHFRRKEPAIFTGVKFEKLRKTVDSKVVNFLPYRCSDGCAIVLIQLDNWDPRDFLLEDIKRMVALLFLQAVTDPMTQVNGFKVIFDVQSNPVRHIRYATPSNLYLMYHGTQTCVPGRFKGVHIINTSLTFKAAWLIIKPFMSDKLKSRIHFHSDHRTLSNFFPENVLPVEYGGNLKDYDQTDWLRRAASPENLVRLYGSSS